MHKIKRRKLILDREKIRELTDTQLGMEAGGLSVTGSTYPTVTCGAACDPTTNLDTHCKCWASILPTARLC